jgi:hypothetical protein
VARPPGPRLLLLRPLRQPARAQPNGGSVAEKGGMAPLAASQAHLASSIANITRSVSERRDLEYKARNQPEEGASGGGASVTRPTCMRARNTMSTLFNTTLNVSRGHRV